MKSVNIFLSLFFPRFIEVSHAVYKNARQVQPAVLPFIT